MFISDIVGWSAPFSKAAHDTKQRGAVDSHDEREPEPTHISHRVTASFRHSPVLVWGPSEIAGGYLIHHGSPWAVRGHPASPWSSPCAAEESLLWHPKHILLRLYRPWCLQGSFSHTFFLISMYIPPHPCPVLKSVIPVVLPASLIDMALARGLVCPGATWCWLCLTQGKLLAASFVPCNQNHVMQTECTTVQASSNMKVCCAELTGI